MNTHKFIFSKIPGLLSYVKTALQLQEKNFIKKEIMSKKQITVPIFIPHLGCPHTCAFCNQWETSGSRKLPDKVFIENQINLYLSKKSDSVTRIEVAFFGGSFTGIEKHIQEELLGTVHPYLQKNIINGIRLSTRPDYIDDSALELLKKFGVTTIELGVQSLNDGVLEASKRGHTANDSIKAIKKVKDAGFETVVQLMPGLPMDNMEISIDTAMTVCNCNPDAVRIYPVIVLKNTLLYQMYRKGEYSPLSLDEAVETCSRIYEIFNKKSIKIIRMGLHPFTDKEKMNIIAGPYNTSFGFLVKSRIKRNLIQQAMDDFSVYSQKLKEISLLIPEKEKEEYIGLKKSNISWLKKEYNIDKIYCSIKNISDIQIKPVIRDN